MPRRVTRLRPLFAPWLLAAVIGGGCASSDLSGDAGIRHEVAICLPPGTPGPALIARAMWFPNAGGVASTDASLVHVSGVLALAGDKLFFMAWNDHEHHFDMLHVVDCIGAESVSVDRVGVSSMLVVRSGNDLLDSFELMDRGELASDAKATGELLGRIQALRARSPQGEP
jgi:hypothetical protein